MLGAHHPLVKSIRKAVQRGARTEDGLAVAEGFHLLIEAERSATPIAAILATPAAAARLHPHPHLHLIDDATLHHISSLETSQGVLSLLQISPRPLDALFPANPLVLALDGLQDPGNAGAIVRAAEAFGATGVVFLKGSASPWNPKTLRASAGSLLRLPFATAEWPDFLAAVEHHAVSLFAAHPRAPQPLSAAPLHLPSAILIGNEGRGIPPDHEAHAQPIRIPTRHVESLNAALAAGILLYEASRQRQ